MGGPVNRAGRIETHDSRMLPNMDRNTYRDWQGYLQRTAAGSIGLMMLLGMSAASAFALCEDPEAERASIAVVGMMSDSRAGVRQPWSDDDLFFLGTGRASYSGARFAGRPTASGEIFDPNAFTAAHPSLPFGTRVRVTNLANDRSVTVRINDRGPYTGGRIIDLSRAAAEEIGMIASGTARVKLEQYP